jgi:hypothetical protein
MAMGEALRQVVWHDENHRPDAATTGCYREPPPWPYWAWEITRFEAREDGAVLHLWFSAIPATPAQPGSTTAIQNRQRGRG